MTQADLLRANVLALLGLEYELGDEFHHEQGYISTPGYPKDGDCSGLVYAAYFDSDIRWSDGSKWPRLTADGYRRRAVKVLDKQYRTGDVACFSNSSRTYHIALVYEKNPGDFWTIEARGERWGVVTYPMNAAPDSVLYRGATIYRFPWVDLGTVTFEEEDTLNTAELALLKHADMAASQGTYDNRVTSRLLIKDYAGAVDINNGFYERWPDHNGPLPRGITAEELAARLAG